MAYPLIVIEGVDYSGKTTIIEKLKNDIKEPVYFGHEPGGTGLSENIRSLLFNYGKELNPLEKLQLFEISRRNFVENVIKPQLKKSPVILDRFIGSTISYQAFGDHIDLETVVRYNEIAVGDLKIDSTILLEIDLETFRNRKEIRDENNDLDNYDYSFYQNIIDNYRLSLDYTNSKNIEFIDAKQSPEDVYDIVKLSLKMKGIKI